jgi:sugar lactone lactonase YvrE
MGVAADAQGDLFVADTNNNIIRKIDSTGMVTTFAGIANSAGTTDGAESNAQFSLPGAIACDSTGTNVFVADSDNQTIRQIIVGADGAGTVTTIAGLADTVGSTDGSESGALFNFPQGLALASNGTLYVSDSGNDTIRVLTPTGTGFYAVTTLAGTIGVRGHVDATGSAAQFNSPFGLAADNAGNVFVADAFNYVIRKIDPHGVVTTIAGQAGSAGDTDGSGTSEARFTTPQFLGVDPATGNIFVADTRNNTIRLLTPDTDPVSGNPTGTYTVSTIAGAPPEGSTGYEDGPSPIARFDEPYGIAADTDGNLYVGDSLNATVRRISKGADGTYGTGSVTTIAGVVQYSGNTNGKASGAQFWYPYGVAVQGTGNNAQVYVADSFNSIVRKIDMSQGGLVTTIAGIAGVRGAVDGAESTAIFLMPTSVAVDSAGIVYVADSANSTIRKIVPAANGTTDGTVYTVAGAAGSFSYADGVGTAARFNTPTGIAVDSGDNLYVADKGNNVIRKITPFGVVTTLAGSQLNSGTQDGVGTNAWFNAPAEVSVDADGNVYVTDSGNQTIRKITPDRIVTTLGGSAGQTGSLDGTGSAALFNFPTGVAVDGNGVLYVADTMNNTIRQGVSNSGSSGSGGGGSGSGGSGSGGSGGGGSGGSGGSGAFVYNPATPGTPNSQAAGVFQAVNLFAYPAGLARDSSGNLYVADPADNIIQKINSSGMVATLAGMAGAAGAIDATGSYARFNQPNGVTVDGSGNVYVADTGNGAIRKISPAGVVTTLAGSISNRGNQDGTGLNAWFSSPTGIATDGTGNVYVADSFTNTIRKVTATGTVSTVAGSASVRGGSADGTGTAAQFNYPTGIAVDGSGNLFVADTYNDTVRKIASGGVVTTVAGVAGLAGSNDNAPSVPALFNQPMGITVDSNGNVFVADTVNCTIRELTSSGNVTTVAGNAGTAGTADGTSSTSLFNQPRGLVPDGAGNLYVADTGNAAIRKIAIGTTTVTVSTPAMTQGTINQTGSVVPVNTAPIVNSDGVSVGTSGGAVEPPFLALLALLGILRWLTRQK